MRKLPQYLIYFFIVGVISQGVIALIDECPSPEENYPCYCEEDDGPTVMHCNYLNESKQLHQALSSLSEYKVYKINVFKNEMNVKSDAFKGPAISQIMFTNSTVFMESPQFIGQESSLTRLTFLSCFNKTNKMNSWDFGHLDRLRDVTFDRNTIEVLGNDWITSTAPSLRSLSFTECNIEKLGNKVFQTVTELATLFLSDNQITSISRSMFPRPAENLRTINLNNNKLQDLPDDIFEEMPSLNTVELQNNLFKTMPELTWSLVIEKLSRVYLDGNPIRCDKSLKWISKKSLPKTFTAVCEEPPKLKGKKVRILTPASFH